VKVIVHVQITRVISIYHSYFLYNIFWEKPIYKFRGEYCLNVRKQIEYKSSACTFFFNIFYFKLNAFFLFFFNLYVFNIFFSMLNRCLWCHFGHFHHQNTEKLCYPRRCSRLIRTEWRHSLGLPRGDNHVELRL
jgi:hypothetical protein